MPRKPRDPTEPKPALPTRRQTGHYVMPPPPTRKGVGAGSLTIAQRRSLYELFREHTSDAVSTLVNIMLNEDANNSDRIAAAKEILNRGYGQAPTVAYIEAQLQVKHSINTDVIRQMSAEELATFEAMLSRVAATSGDVIEGTTNESTNDAP